ncbi:ATP-grasp domain-containing protein [Serratia ureilytica]|uniref:ATP-grasp domain-containing protein n=1 Tax=Serratia ureilytica TaxID=300181 RepID=UPI0039B64988
MSNPVIIYAGLRRTNGERFEVLAAAKRLGLSVVLIARSVPEMAKQHVAEWHVCDTSNYADALKVVEDVASRHKVVGAISWTDLDLGFVARINETLSLPGMSSQTVQTVRNKYRARQAVSAIAELCPRFHLVSTLEELKYAMEVVGYPAVIKPTGGNGSKGIFILQSPSDLDGVIDKLTTLITTSKDPIFDGHKNEFIVEQFIDGNEVSVEVLVHQGKVDVVGITDKQTTEPFHFELQHIFPATVSQNANLDVQSKVVQMVKLLGCNNCALHIEGKIKDDKFSLIEINGRPGGDYITTHLIPYSTGIDHVVNILKVATGQRPDLNIPKSMSYAGIRFLFTDRKGQYLGLEGYDDVVLETPGLDHVLTELPTGSQVALPPESFTTQRVASVMAHGPSSENVAETLLTATQFLKVRIK